jgi:hypothetical protein
VGNVQRYLVAPAVRRGTGGDEAADAFEMSGHDADALITVGA